MHLDEDEKNMTKRNEDVDKEKVSEEVFRKVSENLEPPLKKKGLIVKESH